MNTGNVTEVRSSGLSGGLAAKMMIIAVAAFGLTTVVASRLGSEFLPELDEGTTWVNFTLSPNVSTQEASRILHMARKALLTVPEVRTTVSKAGQPEEARGILNHLLKTLETAPISQRKAAKLKPELQESLREAGEG